MKTFIINKKQIIFGCNAKENTQLVKKYKEKYPNGYWFHLSNTSSSHGFYLDDIKLTSDDKRIIGNILLNLSKIKNGKYYMDICNLENVNLTKSTGLVSINNSKKFKIKLLYGFNIQNYQV